MTAISSTRPVMPRLSDRWDMGYQWISRFGGNQSLYRLPLRNNVELCPDDVLGQGTHGVAAVVTLAHQHQDLRELRRNRGRHTAMPGNNLQLGAFLPHHGRLQDADCLDVGHHLRVWVLASSRAAGVVRVDLQAAGINGPQFHGRANA